VTSATLPLADNKSAGRAAPRAGAQIRDRWRIGLEARALIVVTAVLLSFGLATLYSASAFASVQGGHGSAFFLLKQLSGVAVGAVIFAVAAKLDAELWSKYAWVVMGLALATMAVTVLPFTTSIAVQTMTASFANSDGCTAP
jgi:cell division protein FtsW